MEDILVTRAAELIETEIDGELVALDVERGTCFGFNVTAWRVWALIAPSATLSRIIGVLRNEFAIDEPTCRREVDTLLDRFVAEGLVTVAPAA